MGASGYWAEWQEAYVELVNNSDPRIKDYAFVSNPIPPALTVLAYLAFLYIGPAWMKNREPFQLKLPIAIYNFGLVFLNVFIFTEFLLAGWLFDYTFGCQPVDYSTSPKAIRMMNATYYFYLVKFVELLDTVFFILRKKNNQVSFLHVFHHGALPMLWWWGLKKFPGGSATFHCLINSFIHVVMYSYYGLAGLGPKVQKYLWWKKYVTVLQLAQFFLVTIHNGQYIFYDCPQFELKYIIMAQVICTILTVLFLNFYIKSYRQGKKQQNIKSSQNGKTERNGFIANGSASTEKHQNGAATTNSAVTKRHVSVRA